MLLLLPGWHSCGFFDILPRRTCGENTQQIAVFIAQEKDQLVDLLCQSEYLWKFTVCYRNETSATSFLTSSLLHNFNNGSQIKTIFLCWVLQREQSRLSSVMPSHLFAFMSVISTTSSAFNKEFQELRWPVSSRGSGFLTTLLGYIPLPVALMCILMCLDLEDQSVLF